MTYRNIRKLYQNDAKKIIQEIGQDAREILEDFHPRNASGMFYLAVGETVDKADVINKLNKIDNVTRKILDLYHWPEIASCDDPSAFYAERYADQARQPLGPEWQPLPGEFLVFPQPSASQPLTSNLILDLRGPAFRTIEAVAAAKDRITCNDAAGAAEATAAAIGLINSIGARLQSYDLIRTALAVRGPLRRRVPYPPPPEHCATLAEAAREVAQEIGANPEAIERWWRRNGTMSPKPFRKPKTK
jgi:hypothetical protein